MTVPMLIVAGGGFVYRVSRAVWLIPICLCVLVPHRMGKLGLQLVSPTGTRTFSGQHFEDRKKHTGNHGNV